MESLGSSRKIASISRASPSCLTMLSRLEQLQAGQVRFLCRRPGCVRSGKVAAVSSEALFLQPAEHLVRADIGGDLPETGVVEVHQVECREFPAGERRVKRTEIEIGNRDLLQRDFGVVDIKTKR